VKGGTVASEQDGFPEIVIAPAHPRLDGAEADIVFELRQASGGQAPDGATVLPVFSSVRRLVDTLGHDQPWVALPLVKVRELAGAGGVRLVELDPSAEPGAWRWTGRDLETLAREESAADEAGPAGED
jgi:hypothetical protein